MSKVIKSSSVDIQSPKLIVHEKSEPNCRKTGTEVFNEQTEKEVKARSEEIEKVREQTVEILQETEQMVRDLLETARQEAQKIINRANEEAERIIAEGNEQVKQIHGEAREEGRENGYQDGLKIAGAEYRAKILEADELVVQAHHECRGIIEGSETEIIRLAVAVARKVVGEEIKLDPERVVAIVKRAIQKAADREELTVRVNPEELDVTLNNQDEIIQSATGIRKLKIKADSSVSSGGCVVESQNGTVDARIERQLDEIEQALTEVGPNA